MDDRFYRDWKTGHVSNTLARAGVRPETWLEPAFIPQASRRRAGFKVLKAGGRVIAGFHGERSHRIVPVDGCLVLEPAVLTTLERSMPWLLRLLPEGRQADLDVQHVDGQLDLILSLPVEYGRSRGAVRHDRLDIYAEWAEGVGAARISRRTGERGPPETMIARSPVMVRFGDLGVALPAGAFLQPSRAGEAVLGDTALAMLDGRATSCLADLFAGCGTFAGRLLGRGAVHAVEGDAAACAALDRARPGHRLTVERRDLFTAPLTVAELKRYDAVLLDPPRAGAAAQVEQLARSKVPAVVYVSCSPVTFARDAARLCEAGFRLTQARVIDQFLWSRHTELIGLFIR